MSDDIPIKRVLADPEHEVAYQDLCALVNQHAAKVSVGELLAIAANMVGKLVAMQDQRVMTPAMALKLVATNIERGNQQILDKISQTKGSA